jgi:hypothetical protein
MIEIGEGLEWRRSFRSVLRRVTRCGCAGRCSPRSAGRRRRYDEGASVQSRIFMPLTKTVGQTCPP